MAEPDAKMTVPVGARFLLRWTADKKAQVTNVFRLADQSIKRVPGPKPKPSYKPPEEVELEVKVTRDGQDYWFRTGMPDPQARLSDDWRRWVFTSKFMAREPGVFLFSIALPNGDVLDKEVTVEPAPDYSDKRDYMLDIINRWMPASVQHPRVPTEPSEDQLLWEARRALWTEARVPDLMELSGWTKGTIDKALETKKATGLVTTSCGDVLAKVLSLWGVDFDGDGKGSTRAFGIRDDGAEKYTDDQGVVRWRSRKGLPPVGAVTHGYYVSASEAFAKSPPELPRPGDILVLANSDKPGSGTVGHVGVVVAASLDIWTTADGGQGGLSNHEQSALVGDREVTYTAPTTTHPMGLPIMKSVTDAKSKAVDGWVDLDRVPNLLFELDGTKKAGAWPTF